MVGGSATIRDNARVTCDTDGTAGPAMSASAGAETLNTRPGRYRGERSLSDS